MENKDRQRLLRTINQASAVFPELRFGQMLACSFNTDEIFNISDEKITKALEQYIKDYGKKRK